MESNYKLKFEIKEEHDIIFKVYERFYDLPKNKQIECLQELNNFCYTETQRLYNED